MTAGEHLSKLTDEQVRDTVAKLKQIEEKASAVLEAVTQERATFNHRIYAEIERRKQQIKDNAEREVKQLNEQAHKDAVKRAEKIEQENNEKKKIISDTFAANRERWRKDIFENILAGV